MRFFSPVIIFIGTAIIAASVIASVVYHYQRERSFIEDKYTARDSQEIDDTYHTTYLRAGEIDETIVPEDASYSDNLLPDDQTSSDQLKVVKYEKTAWDGDAHEWRKSVTVDGPGETVLFKVYMELENPGGTRQVLRLGDMMTDSLLGPVTELIWEVI